MNLASESDKQGARLGSSMSSAHIILLVVLTIFVTPPLALMGLWIASLPVWNRKDDLCAFNSISRERHLDFLAQAKAQQWTLWPGLSKGLFWPADRVLDSPSIGFNEALGDRLLQAVNELTAGAVSGEVQLAAAHAVMRSVGADLTSVFEIPDLPQNGKAISTTVQFRYFIAQRRFAPLCLHCVVWPYSTIVINFRRDLQSNERHLAGVVVLHGGLKYDPNPTRERNIDGKCAEFPSNEKGSQR